MKDREKNQIKFKLGVQDSMEQNIKYSSSIKYRKKIIQFTHTCCTFQSCIDQVHAFSDMF